MENKLVVSVQMITYGHEAYIKQAVEGVLMQETDFEFDLIIADDCSPDKTPEIINEIIKTHPNGYRIKYFRHRENIGMNKNGSFALSKCKGKYIAICEGDDYWTDPYKLQKQVDFLEGHPDCSFCFHDVQKTQGNKIVGVIKSKKYKQFFNTKDILISNGNEMATCSLLFKTALLKEIPDFSLKASVGDFPLKLLLSEFGDIGYIPINMAVYRYQTQNSWSSKKQFAFEQHYFKMKTFLNEYSKWSQKKNKKYIKRNCSIRKADYIRIKIENSNTIKEKLFLLFRNIFSYNIYYTLINIKKIL